MILSVALRLNDNPQKEEYISTASANEIKSFIQAGDRPLLQKEGSFVLQKEDSFIRTGSGRKLPKIPHRSLSANSGLLNIK